MQALASTPSRRHLFLGQTLMLGLLMCCATTTVISLKPSPALCAVSRVGIGLSYSVVYSTLLVKLVFLISLNSGVYLPATYQVQNKYIAVVTTCCHYCSTFLVLLLLLQLLALLELMNTSNFHNFHVNDYVASLDFLLF